MTETTPSLPFTALVSDQDDETRQRILDAALALFVDYGLRRTTMEDVATKCGIGRATLYRRFKEKDQLFQAVILREVQRNLVLIEQAIASMDNPLDGLLEAFVKAVSLSHRHPLMSRLLSSEPENVLPYLTTQLGAPMAFANHYLSAQIERAQKRKKLAKRPAKLLSEMILRLVHSLVLSPQGVLDPANEDGLRRFAQQFLRPLLEP